jgi:hypothetical protein
MFHKEFQGIFVACVHTKRKYHAIFQDPLFSCANVTRKSEVHVAALLMLLIGTAGSQNDKSELVSSGISSFIIFHTSVEKFRGVSCTLINLFYLLIKESS